MSSLRKQWAGLLAVAVAMGPSVAGAADVGPGGAVSAFDNRTGQQLPATRIRDEDLQLDGRLDDVAWKDAKPLPRFVQVSPRYGAEPEVETEVYIVYGSRGLYVGLVCHQPTDTVVAPVGRKDNLPPGDEVSIDVDSNHDHTNGFLFGVNAAGGQMDAQISQDRSLEFLWDGVWDARTARDPRGWTAEISVPWSTLRFDARKDYTFGINVTRNVNYLAQELALSPAPQGVPGRLSYAADYTGVQGISPGLNLEVRPFISGRFALRRPPESLDHSWRGLPNAGFSAKYGLRGNLTFDVAVNPDFGQAEVDPAVLNLGPLEVFFQERRQFFLESKQIFETPFQLFYSRRVGNNPSPAHAQTTRRVLGGELERGELVELDPSTRILDSVRVSGEVAPGWQVGAMSATTGPSFGVQRFSDGTRERIPVDPTTQYTVGRVRRQYDSQTYIGGIVTSVVRPGALEDSLEATAGGIDYNVRFRQRWNHSAQVIGTQAGQQVGMGAALGLARSSKNMESSFGGRMLTPGADFNDLGYMQFANFVEGAGQVAVFTSQPVGSRGQFRQLGTGVDFKARGSFDGYMVEKAATGNVNATTASLWNFHTFGGGHLPQFDLFETRGGIPYQVPAHWWTGGGISSPYNRRVSANVGGNYGVQSSNIEGRGGTWGSGGNLGLTLRPGDRLQLGLGFNLDTGFGRPRWVANDGNDGTPVFGRGQIVSTDSSLSATLGITPRLTVQSYSQLLHSTVHHEGFYRLTSPSTLEQTADTPYDGVVDQALTALTSNTILRWEYWPGSFVFVAYTHRSVLNGSGMEVRYQFSDAFTGFGTQAARHEDILFLKLVHLFAL